MDIPYLFARPVTSSNPFLILSIACILSTMITSIPAEARDHTDHQLGIFWGKGNYQDQIGDIYQDNGTIVGVHYQAILSRVFSLKFQFDDIAIIDGLVPIIDEQGNEQGQLHTDIKGELYSLNSIFNVNFSKFQFVVPWLGAGITYYHGKQRFDAWKSQREWSHEVNGFGLNLQAGFNIALRPQFGLFADAASHYISGTVDKGFGNKELSTNRITRFCMGFYLRLVDHH